MWKRYLKNGLVGLVAGIAANELIALVSSYVLHLGYYKPCLASLPEQVGGELNAVVLQMALCGLLGMGVGILWCAGRSCASFLAGGQRKRHQPISRLMPSALTGKPCSVAGKKLFER